MASKERAKNLLAHESEAAKASDIGTLLSAPRESPAWRSTCGITGYAIHS